MKTKYKHIEFEWNGNWWMCLTRKFKMIIGYIYFDKNFNDICYHAESSAILDIESLDNIKNFILDLKCKIIEEKYNEEDRKNRN